MEALLFDPGALRTRLILERPNPVSDGQGGVQPSYIVISTLWTKIEPLSMEMDEIGSQWRGVATHKVFIRYRSGLLEEMRFRLGTRIFDILTFRDPDESGRYLEILCQEGAL